jgi:hypothetical protein
MWFAYTNNFANWHVQKIEKYRNHQKQTQKQSVLHLGLCIEVIQETRRF